MRGATESVHGIWGTTLQDTSSPTWVAVFGFPFEGMAKLNELIRGIIPQSLPFIDDQPLLRLVQLPEFQQSGAVSSFHGNIASVGKVIDTRPDVRVIVMLEDPRILLDTKASGTRGSYRYGFDHCLHTASNGVVTLSDPGLVYNSILLRSIAKRGPPMLVVKHSELLQSPDQIADDLGTFICDRAMPTVRPVAVDTPFSIDQSGTSAERLVRQFRLSPDLFDIVQRWGYGSDRSWFDRLAARAPHAFEDRPGTIVGYYTRGTRYEREASRMLSSLANLGLPVALSAVEDTGNWLGNVRRKPHFLAARRRELTGPLLYLDVDAVVHKDPWPYLRGYAGDCAIAGHHATNFISGTILINDTDGARAFLDRWCTDQDTKPEAWDQHSLHDVVMENLQSATPAFSVNFLPPEMCRVFDRTYSPPVTPIIEHLQASRETSAASGDENALTLLRRRRARISEIDTALGLNASSDVPKVDISGIYGELQPEERKARTGSLMRERDSDVERWSNSDNLLSSWSERAKIVAALLAPPGIVLDLGCGKMDLEKFLKSGITYKPSDIVLRDDRTIVCDLNNGEMPQTEATVVTMLGVLEYIYEPEKLLAQLAAQWSRVIITYCPADLDGVRERDAHGWVNALTSSGLVSAAEAAGLYLDAILPSVNAKERVYVFNAGPGTA
jgi:hypothetical protein